MYLSNIKIKNFRLFSSIKLTLNPGLNVIAGENNSGKTALIDAIRLALDTNSAEWNRVKEDDFNSASNEFSIELEFDGITVEQASIFVEHLTHKNTSGEERSSVLHVKLSAKLTNNIRRGNRFINTEFRSGLDGSGPQIERGIRDYLSATYLKPLRDAEQELSSGRSSRLAQILASKRELRPDTDDFKALLEVFIQASGSFKDNSSIIRNQDDIASLVKKLSFKNTPFKPSIQMTGDKPFSEMNETEKARSFSDILERLNLVLDTDKPRQGLGYNNILFMATELLLLKQEEGQFPLLLIEEPEAHLHPQLQMKFLQYLKNWQAEGDELGPQIFLTTHSPNLASKAPLESVIIMNEGTAFPLRKGETLLEDDDYVFLEKFLDVTKANLFFARGILIVEGDAEAILLPTIAELLGRNLEDYGVSIVNVGSTAFARFAKIFLRKNNDDDSPVMPMKVAVLRDLDLWPASAEKTGGNPHGFKEKKEPNEKGHGGNLAYWLDPTKADQVPSKIEALQKGIHEQNVRVQVSDEWTFEYCLIKSGLHSEIATSLNCELADFPEDPEGRAVALYNEIESSSKKTELAYSLSSELTRNYSRQGGADMLRSRLPSYILEAIDHVTEEHSDANVPSEAPVAPAVMAAAAEDGSDVYSGSEDHDG